MKQIATIILVFISLTSFGQGGTKFTVKGNGSGGSNVGDSVKKNTDTLVIHNTRIIKNTDSLVSHNTRIGKHNDSLISHNTRIGSISTALSYTAKVYNILAFGADSTGVSDATTAIRSAIAAASYSGGTVFIPHGTYKVTDSIVITANNVQFLGEGESSKILASGDYGNIFSCHPAATPTTQTGGIQGIQFNNFYIESSTTRTFGAAIYAKYSYNFIVSNMRIGTPDWVGNNSVTMRIYDAVYLQYESAAIVTGSQLYPTHYGVYFAGQSVGSGAVGLFYWDGLVTGNCNIWGKRNSGAFVTGSVGVYIAGGCGGVQIEQTNISWFENGVKASGTNRELFIGHAFSADDCGGAGIYIKDTLNILQMTGGWAAGNARGAQTPAYNLYLDSLTKSQDGTSYDSTNIPRINITGGTIYASGVNGIYLGTGRINLTGVSIYGNTTAANSMIFGGNVKAVSWVGGRCPVYTSYVITPIIRGVMGLSDVGNLGTPVAGAAGSNTQLQYNNANALAGSSVMTFNGTKLSISGNQFASTFNVGTLQSQSYSVNNAFITDNVNFNGTNFQAVATGTGSLLYYQAGELQYKLAPSVSAGSNFVFGLPLKINKDSIVVLGGNISGTPGTYTGATMFVNSAGAAIGTNGSAAAASSLLEISSTTKGFLPPRMTATQASAISSPAEGLMVYVTSTNGTFTAKGWWGWDGAAWQKLNN